MVAAAADVQITAIKTTTTATTTTTTTTALPASAATTTTTSANANSSGSSVQFAALAAASASDTQAATSNSNNNNNSSSSNSSRKKHIDKRDSSNNNNNNDNMSDASDADAAKATGTTTTTTTTTPTTTVTVTVTAATAAAASATAAPTKSAVSQRNVDIKIEKCSNMEAATQQLTKKVLKLDLGGKNLDEYSLKSPKSPIAARLPHQTSLTSSVDVEDRKTLREALYQGIFHRHRRTIFAVGSFLRMLRSRNSQYNTIRSSSEGEDIDEFLKARKVFKLPHLFGR
ncbi:osteocalcin 2 isoform X2 [Drosophila virilis]|uniref:osteocalcin 2 isoform X2 n=1 Tax=Drosophila virilis TaxID=7244 RepID=UPI0038B3E912